MRATRSPEKKTRAAAHFQCGAIHQTKGDIRLAGAEFRRAWALGQASALYNLVYVERGLGHDETALAMARQTLGLNRSIKDASGSIRRMEVARGHHELQIGDYLGARDDFATALTPNGNSALTAGRQYENLAAALIGLHDTGAARRQIAVMMSGSIYRDRLERFRTALEVRAAAQDEDWVRVLQTLDAGHPRPTQGLLWTPTPNAWRALALARLGRLDEADRYAAALPRDCNTCLRVRAHLAEARGNRARADRWFAEAVRQAPSSPFGDEAWGRVLLARGDLQGAVRLARSGAKKSPNFADPVELWGEALLAQGDAKAAATKFTQAAKLAPRWGRLHLKWGEALAKLGRSDEARAKWRAAATMDLSAADRAALKAHGV